MKNINLLLPNPLLIYHEKFSPRIAAGIGSRQRPDKVQIRFHLVHDLFHDLAQGFGKLNFKGLFIFFVGGVNGFQLREMDESDHGVFFDSKDFLYSGQDCGDDPASRSQGFHQHQGQAFKKGGQDKDVAAPHQRSQGLMAQGAVVDGFFSQSPGQGLAGFKLPARAAAGQVKAEGPVLYPVKAFQKPGHAFGSAEFSGVQNLHGPFKGLGLIKKAGLIIPAADDINPCRVGLDGGRDLFLLVQAQGNDPLDFRKIGRDGPAHLRTQIMLAQAGAVAGRDHGDMGIWGARDRARAETTQR